MARSSILGMTDYSHQSFEDMVKDLEDWIEYLKSKQILFREYSQKFEEIGYWAKLPFNVCSLFEYSTKFFETSQGELKEILNEVKKKLKKHHVNRIMSLSQTSEKLEIDYIKVWKSVKSEDFADYDDPTFRLLEDLFDHGRRAAANMLELSTLAGRLEDFVGRKGVKSKAFLASSEEIAHKEAISKIHIRRLRELEKKQALHGANSDPAMIIEIEDVQNTINNLNDEITRSKST